MCFNAVFICCRDSSGLECDAVLHLRNGQYALIEIKLSRLREEEGAKTLNSLKSRIEKEGMKSLDFMMIITATGFAHRRKDGIFVVPTGCLRY